MSASASVSLPNALTPWPVYSANIFTSPYECFSFPFIVSYMPHLITEPNMISTENDRWGGEDGKWDVCGFFYTHVRRYFLQ